MLNHLLFRPLKALPCFDHAPRAHARLLVVHEGQSPTLHYFLAAFAARAPELELVQIDSRQPPTPAQAPRAGDKVILVRFVPRNWQAFFSQYQSGVRFVWFIDDDLLDPATLVDQPADYRRRLLQKGRVQQRWLRKHCHRLWVASPHLAHKYRHLQPVLVEPRAYDELLESAQAVRIAYHGTASHRDEKSWLRDVMQPILEQHPEVSFEIFGDHEINRLYRDLPRVSVLHPMSWENYLHYTRTHQSDIVLAPLLDGAFNQARSPTKFYDCVRLGAVGIFSDVAPYRDLVESGVDGLLLGNEPALWQRTLRQLISSPTRRRQLADAARSKALAMSVKLCALASLLPLLEPEALILDLLECWLSLV